METTLNGKTALVLGATSGVGKATAQALVAEGARVTGVARGVEGLDRLRGEVAGVETLRADATDGGAVDALLRELRPDLVVLTAGAVPPTAPLPQQTWETFTMNWNADTKAAFHVLQAALGVPLRPGSAVVVVSSGAALKGSPLSGGYAGAKRMQWLLAEYAQKWSDASDLKLRILSILPTQFIEGTATGKVASEAYGARQGLTGAEVMRRFPAPLDPGKVAAAIVGALRGTVAPGATAIGVDGQGATAIA